MKKTVILFINLIFILCCENEETVSPQIIFKSDNVVLSADTIEVSLNSIYELIVQTVGTSKPKYFFQANNGTQIDLCDTEDLRILKQSYGNEYVETAEITTSFPDSLFKSCDIVRIKVEVSDYIKSINYKIQ